MTGAAGTAPRGRRIAAVLAALAVAAAALLVLRPGGGVSGDSAEAGFARDMSTHHAQAVKMAFLVRDRSDDERVRTLTYDMIATQSAQIGMMTAWLDAWNVPHTDPRGPMRWMNGHGHGDASGTKAMPGMATPEQLRELEKADGRAAEIVFLRLMLTHHKAGVEMARAAQTRAEDEHVLRLARAMVRGQQAEIDLMQQMLTERTSPA
ncbi:DUF305 domain-containing protein [Actinomadura flavalba]|uniref:DUF305 domain-containing protein n=1 Tax=Actinomadura flavalba TaxID=1120938 RepID=UPI00035D9624|nr:DUF305 domain-containing protein [Actinomadura flavalba]